MFCAAEPFFYHINVLAYTSSKALMTHRVKMKTIITIVGLEFEFEF